jgi:hypothetical protein
MGRWETAATSQLTIPVHHEAGGKRAEEETCAPNLARGEEGTRKQQKAGETDERSEDSMTEERTDRIGRLSAANRVSDGFPTELDEDLEDDLDHQPCDELDDGASDRRR